MIHRLPYKLIAVWNIATFKSYRIGLAHHDELNCIGYTEQTVVALVWGPIPALKIFQIQVTMSLDNLNDNQSHNVGDICWQRSECGLSLKYDHFHSDTTIITNACMQSIAISECQLSFKYLTISGLKCYYDFTFFFYLWRVWQRQRYYKRYFY